MPPKRKHTAPVKRIKHRPLFTSIERDALHVAEDAFVDTLEELGGIVWDAVIGTIRLIYFMLMALINAILPLLVFALVWWFCRDVIVYGAEYFNVVLAVVLDIVNDIIGAIDWAISGLNSAVSDVSFGSVHIHMPYIHVLSSSEILGPVYTTLSQLDDTCFALDTWQKVIDVWIKLQLSDRICPFLRFIWPLTFVFTPIYSVTYWMTWDPAPFPEANCRALPDADLCAWFNFYLVLFEVAWFIVVYVFVKSYQALLRRLWHILRAVLILCWHAIAHFIRELRHPKSD